MSGTATMTPADARGNKVCDYGHQWTFKWIPAAKAAQGSGVRGQGNSEVTA